MALSDIVDVVITRVSSAVTQQSFSTPLVLAYHTRWTDERVRSYASIEELEDDDFTSDDATHKIFTEIFTQPNPPAEVKLGRRASAFTQTVRLTPTAANSTAYTVEIDGLEATFTSDASATVAEVCTGVAAAINALADADAIIVTGGSTGGTQTLTGASLDGATGYRALSPSRRLTFTFSSHADWDATTITVTGKDAAGATITETFAVPNGGNATVTGSKLFARVTQVSIPAQSGTGGTFTMGVAAPMTATDDTTHVTLTNVAGLLASVEVTGAGVLAVDDRTADPGIAADLAACRAEDDDWYCLLLDSNSRAEIQALDGVIEAASPKKIMVVQSADTGCTEADTITDVMYGLKDGTYFRSACFYHPTIALNWIAAAVVGSALAYDPGSVTWHLRELTGITSYTLTSAQRAAILAKNGNLFETIAGRNVTVGGEMAGGEWIDIIHGLDWHHARIGERIFGVMVSAYDRKLGFTDAGIARINTELRAQMTDAETAGLFDAGWTTSVPRASALTSTQRRSRTLPNVTFNATVAGAIHAVTVRGTVAA